jgi:hypothetical protein
MTDKRYEELLWEKLDGELEPKGQKELDAYGADHPEMAEEERSVEALANLLSQVESVEPPTELRGKIEWAIAAKQNVESRERKRYFINLPKGGDLMSGLSNRNVVYLVIAAVVVVGAILYLAGGGQPAPEEVTGAIGGVEQAEKYTAEPLAEEDIQLDHPEVQQVLQSDEFQAILENEQMREALASDEMREILTNDNLAAIFASEGAPVDGQRADARGLRQRGAARRHRQRRAARARREPRDAGTHRRRRAPHRVRQSGDETGLRQRGGPRHHGQRGPARCFRRP